MEMYLGLFFSAPHVSTLKNDPELTVPRQDPNFSRSQCHYNLI